MPTNDIDKLAALLARTSNPTDEIALDAIRKANAMLSSRRTTWERFLKGKYPEAFTKSQEGDNPVQDGDKKWFTDGMPPGDITRMLEEVAMNASGSFISFVESVQEWWDEKGGLTERQYTAMKKSLEQKRRR